MIFPAIGEANWYEAISLIFAILMSTGFSAVSQYRNEQKFNTLQEEASKTNAKVYRDGKLKEVLVDDIVKGDQILLQSGDKIPVDGIILEGELKVNQAVLNGESEDAKKLPLGDQAGRRLFRPLYRAQSLPWYSCYFRRSRYGSYTNW